MNIRLATIRDCDDVSRIYSTAFPKSESELVAKLAIDLLSENSTPQTISLVAQTDDSIVGHVAFSPVEVADNENCRAYILAPLAVQPGFQKRRIGSTLTELGMRQLSAMGVNIVFVYGDPEYYGRFGFNFDAARNYTPPYDLQYPFGWQAVVLRPFDMEKVPVKINCVTSLCHPELW